MNEDEYRAKLVNQLPTDPEWVRKADALCKAAADDLGCMVLLIAVQKQGKLIVSSAGTPETGALAEMAKDMPTLLANLAVACEMQDQSMRKGPLN